MPNKLRKNHARKEKFHPPGPPALHTPRTSASGHPGRKNPDHRPAASKEYSQNQTRILKKKCTFATSYPTMGQRRAFLAYFEARNRMFSGKPHPLAATENPCRPCVRNTPAPVSCHPCRAREADKSSRLSRNHEKKTKSANRQQNSEDLQADRSDFPHEGQHL